ncbi:MAG: ABC transporter permease [Eubacterium sp.]|nr:ABC transporter permease [Eubacterium sp.]
MQVFNLFFKIAKKRFLSAGIYLGIFSVLLIFMSMNAIDSNEKNFTVSSINMTIIDWDNSHTSKALKQYLSDFHKIVDLKTEDKDVLQDNLYYQTIDYVLFIEKDFEKKLIEGNTSNLISHSKLFDSTSSYFAQQQINEYINTLNLYIKGGFSIDDALKQTDASLSNTNFTNMINYEANQNNDTLSQKLFYYFQYVSYIMLSMLIVGMTPILMILRKKDITSRINCSSLTLHSKNIQITLGCIVYSFALWLVLIIIGGLFGGFNNLFSIKGLLCILNSFLFLLICVSITLLISTFTTSDNVLNMIANCIGLGMSFLCGIFVPQWFLGDTVLSVARFLPAYWYIKANNMISGFSGDNMSYQDYWTYIGIELIFFITIFSIYLLASKQRKMKE